MKPGDKVRYIGYETVENGIVKEVVDQYTARVVYRCDGQWDRYREYTSCLTYREDLLDGWEDQQKQRNAQ